MMAVVMLLPSVKRIFRLQLVLLEDMNEVYTLKNGLHLLRSWLSLWQEEETILLCATLLLKLYTNIKKQRKMGHITITGISMSIVEAQLKTLLTGEKLEDAAFPRVGIIMGSDSDLPVMKEASRILNLFGVSHEVRIVSAHRTPEMMFSYAKSARERGVQVVIAGAGGAAHLPGMVAALTPVPVIGVPVRSSSLDGLDSLLSIVQVRLPRGVPVATVAINNATNAGLLAVRMLGVGDSDLQARMAQYLEDARDDAQRWMGSLFKQLRLSNVFF
ncbi:uncharacterized protein LOC141626337 [Silene latifolia]|uniref:uncharacterized protein LOC141626337 n=1 Tax=Silene latifolia TaxID=37657 RepID=UPI003D78958B